MTKVEQMKSLKRPLVIPDQLLNCLARFGGQHAQARNSEDANQSHNNNVLALSGTEIAHFPRLKTDKEKCILGPEDPNTAERSETGLAMEQKRWGSQLVEQDLNSLRYVVQKMTICSLGVALVQIGFRKPIEALR